MSEIVFYGAGKEAKHNINRWASEGLSPVCFADADLSKQHTMFCGYEVLSLDEAISRYPDYSLYITLRSGNLLKVTNYLRDKGIPRERIKYTQNVELRRGCKFLGTYIMYANFKKVSTCCNLPPSERVEMGIDFETTLQYYSDWVTQRTEDLSKGNPTACDGCAFLYEDLWSSGPEIPKIQCVNIASLTNIARCNYKCIYCIGEITETAEQDADYTMDILKFHFPSEESDIELEWSNGELCVYKNRKEFMEYVISHKINTTIFTNASIYNPQISEAMNIGLVKLMVSIDAGKPETYAKIRGIDCYDKVLSNLHKYIEYRINQNQLILKYIICEGLNDTFEDIDGFLELAKELDCPVQLINNSHERNRAVSSNTMNCVMRFIDKAHNDGIFLMHIGYDCFCCSDREIIRKAWPEYKH